MTDTVKQFMPRRRPLNGGPVPGALAELFDFHTRVRATVIPEGSTIPVEIKGTIRARTIETKPRYDVIDEKGSIYANLSADVVRKDAAA